MSPSRSFLAWVVLGVTAAATFALGLLGASIMERRVEAVPEGPRVPIGEMEVDNGPWGVNFPREHARFERTSDTSTRTRYGGSAVRDLLEEDPSNVILFAGYPFAKDYKQARGHAYTIEDVTATGRLAPTFPATCWSCKSTDVPRLMARMGPEAFYKAKFTDLKSEVVHPVGCLDCHDPATQALRITRPALTEALVRQGRDPSAISHQEMRSLVCAQCHVEYYFKGDGKYLTFPWDKGTRATDMLTYYNEAGFKDWVHAISGTPMIKAQHPDHELYLSGIHAYRDVACADCHMPYRAEGASKFTDHWIRSPLTNISNSCGVCHRWSEAEILSRVESIQDGVQQARLRTEDALVKAHFEVGACAQLGYGDAELATARSRIREAQFLWDYVAASNGMGFHAPQTSLQLLQQALDGAHQARLEAARLLAQKGLTAPLAWPDVSTKTKAQALEVAFREGKGPRLVGEATP